MVTSKQVLQKFKQIYVSATVSFVVLFLIGIFFPEWWVTLFSVFLAFVIGDFILNAIIRGGKGHAKIFGDNNFTDKGYAYLAYLLAIVLGTLASEFVASWLMDSLKSIMPWYQALFITNFIASIAVIINLQWRFYDP